MHRLLRPILPASLLSLAITLSACAGADDTEIVVRRSTTDGALTQAELAIDGTLRHVLVLERDDGERAVAVFDDELRLRAIVQSEGDAWIDFDSSAGLTAPVPCTDTCAPVDALSDEVIASVLEDRLDVTTSVDAWREVKSQAEKKLEQQRKDLLNNWAG